MLRDFLPARLGDDQMRATRKLGKVRRSRRAAVLAEVRLVDGGRNDVVFAAGDQQERGSSIVAVVDLGYCSGIEIGKARLEHDPAGGGDRVQLEGFACV